MARGVNDMANVFTWTHISGQEHIGGPEMFNVESILWPPSEPALVDPSPAYNCPFRAGRYPLALASASLMNSPCLVFPYQRVPE